MDIAIYQLIYNACTFYINYIIYLRENKHFHYAKHDKTPHYFQQRNYRQLTICRTLSQYRRSPVKAEAHRVALRRERASTACVLYIEGPRNYLKLFVHITEVYSFNAKA